MLRTLPFAEENKEIVKVAHYVVDTNVLVTSMGKNDAASAACEDSCSVFLEKVYADGSIVSLDSTNNILNEYARHCGYSGQPKFANLFFKWLFNNQGNSLFVEQIDITNRHNSPIIYFEIPEDPDLIGFDQDDQKFLAVCLASPNNPSMINGTDSDWEDYRDALEALGLVLITLC